MSDIFRPGYGLSPDSMNKRVLLNISKLVDKKLRNLWVRGARAAVSRYKSNRE